jgi:MoxR-like ATPase
MSYQSAEEEAAIVRRNLDGADVSDDWLNKAVSVVRRTRSHSDLRVGSSVRGAVDFAKVAVSLASLRESTINNPSVGVDSALVALSGRVRVREGSVRTPEEIVTEIWQDVFGRVEGEGGEGKAGAPMSRGTTSP